MLISKIRPNDSNPRFIRNERYKKLLSSIREFPKMLELRPIITDDSGMIIGGNMRFRALKELKYKEIPDAWVKKASQLTDEEIHRFIVEDNVQFGEWDYGLLLEKWQAMKLDEWGVEKVKKLDEVPRFEPKNTKDSKEVLICPKCGYQWER
jgi:hypothetical protein